MDAASLKDRVVGEVDARADLLTRVARAIHARPELGHQEHFAHDLLTGELERAGLRVQRSAYGLATAFTAQAGFTGPLVAVLCEYDALPGLGHACGHNVIAAIGLGAGIAAATVAGQAGGTLLVLGTPSEEAPPGGKELLLAAGAFTGVEAALMIHPAGAELKSMNALAGTLYEVHYTGLAAHAAAAPERGRSALDAAVLGYVNVMALRHHIDSSERIHGIFIDAGTAANVIPDRAVARWGIRASTLALLEPLEQRVLACLQGGADAAECAMQARMLGRIPDVRTNEALIDCYIRNMTELGRAVHDPALGGAVIASTDMGAVSYAMPSIHPMIKLAPADVSIHDPEFAEHACSPAADAAVLDGAKALAMTIVDLWADPAALPAARAAFAGSSAASPT